MNESQEKIVELVAEAQVSAISFDLEIATDNLKYSTWCTAIATAGLGLAITSWEKLVRPGTSGTWVVLALLAVSIPLITSVAIGAFTNWQLNKEFSRKRQEMTFVLKQQVILVADDDVTETGRDLGQAMMDLKFLSTYDSAKIASLKRAGDTAPNIEKLVLFQQAAAAVGYVAALSVAASRWL